VPHGQKARAPNIISHFSATRAAEKYFALKEAPGNDSGCGPRNANKAGIK